MVHLQLCSCRPPELLPKWELTAPCTSPHTPQVPAILLVSAGAGLLGAGFNWMRLALRPLRAPGKRHGRRLAEAAALAAVTLLLSQAASVLAGSCLPLPEGWETRSTVQLLCKEGEYNDLATLLFGSGMDVVADIMALGSQQAVAPQPQPQPAPFTPLSLGVLTACYLFLMPLSATALAVPGGLVSGWGAAAPGAATLFWVNMQP